MREFSGSLFGVYVGGVKVDCEISADFSADVEMLPASAIDSARWTENIAGYRSWSMAVNGYLLLEAAAADGKTILDAILTGEILSIEFRTEPGSVDGSYIIAGDCLVQNFGIGSNSEDAVNWTVNMVGTGPFTATFTPAE